MSLNLLIDIFFFVECLVKSDMKLLYRRGEQKEAQSQEYGNQRPAVSFVLGTFIYPSQEKLFLLLFVNASTAFLGKKKPCQSAFESLDLTITNGKTVLLIRCTASNLQRPVTLEHGTCIVFFFSPNGITYPNRKIQDWERMRVRCRNCAMQNLMHVLFAVVVDVACAWP
jgi:hypothetical protein